MSKLIDIEKRYATELVEFFCKGYQEMYEGTSISVSGKNRLVLIGFIEKQIQSRLVNTGLVRNYLVRIDELNKSELRDLTIKEVLGEEISIKDHINVLLEFRDSTKSHIKTNTLIESLSK
jgi:hypothetical protein